MQRLTVLILLLLNFPAASAGPTRAATALEGIWSLTEGQCKESLLLSRTDRGFAAEFRSYRKIPDEKGEPQTVEVREAVAATRGSLHNDGGWSSTLDLSPTAIAYSTGYTAGDTAGRATWAFRLRDDGLLEYRYQATTGGRSNGTDRACVYRLKSPLPLQARVSR